MSSEYNRLKTEKSKYTQIKNKFPIIEKEWKTLKTDMSSLINKIPMMANLIMLLRCYLV